MGIDRLGQAERYVKAAAAPRTLKRPLIPSSIRVLELGITHGYERPGAVVGMGVEAPHNPPELHLADRPLDPSFVLQSRIVSEEPGPSESSTTMAARSFR